MNSMDNPRKTTIALKAMKANTGGTDIAKQDVYGFQSTNRAGGGMP